MAYILIVDDDPDMCASIQAGLGDAYETETENDLEKAREKIAARRPDVLILDVMFPREDAGGFLFAQELKKQEEFKDLPILMLTGINQEFSFDFGPDDIDGEHLPVSDFIEKPADFDLLREKIAALLAK